MEQGYHSLYSDWLYGLDDRDVEVRVSIWSWIFSSQGRLWFTEPVIQWVPGGEAMGRKVDLYIHFP
jgi:hypothetical protein